MIVYLGLGSNLGKKRQNIRKAINQISYISEIQKISSLYETKPEGIENQPFFINSVIKIKTSLSPFLLLDNLISIEEKLGRIKTVKWGPRIIDIDILLYENLVLQDEKLIIPHPLLYKRIFVLLPLNEIAADVIHPVIKKTIKVLLEDLQNA